LQGDGDGGIINKNIDESVILDKSNDFVVGDENIFDEKGNLKPNLYYKSGEYEYFYRTDESGRIKEFTTSELKHTKRTMRLKHDPNTPGKMKGDHAGHIVADRFGGSPKIDNLVSQLASVNLSKYKKIENQWAKAIKKNKTVEINMNVEYEGDSKRPSQFVIYYKIDGEEFLKKISNMGGN